MDILYLLIPLSSLLVLAILGVFAWALNGGQFDELEREGDRILSEAPDSVSKLDFDQVPSAARAKQSGSEHFRL